MGLVRTYHIKQTYTELYFPWQNRAEGEIQEMKQDIKRFTRQMNSPGCLWNYLGFLVAKKQRVTSSSIPLMCRWMPHEQVLGWTPDISSLIQFEWYQWVYYRDHNCQDLQFMTKFDSIDSDNLLSHVPCASFTRHSFIHILHNNFKDWRTYS